MVWTGLGLDWDWTDILAGVGWGTSPIGLPLDSHWTLIVPLDSHRSLIGSMGECKDLCQVGNGAYHLHLPPSMSRLHPVFNVVKLTLALVDPISGRHADPPPSPEIIEGKEEWIVEEIFDSKMLNRKLRYLVKWEGFGIEHNSWEPWDNVHAPEQVTDFHWKTPGAVQHIQNIDFCSLPFCLIGSQPLSS